MSFESQILTILNNSKRGDELPLATTLSKQDYFYFFSNANQRTERIAVLDALNAIQFPFVVIYELASTQHFICKKAAAYGVADIANLEVGDEVYFKDVDDNGDTITLIGWTYDGPDPLIYSSYSQNKTIEI